ncbi:expansin EXLX1 family cellulose-binding protein [Nocardia australiensis]|uniref:expansin EXLX1 family cellulose-binding protein n=1 Tax=Nocardia australiensis TaxID=2887191 RepID=UPI001D14EA34|nr:expansin EXLX1 family cellulose-binding protein [Nocardia australiensis]
MSLVSRKPGIAVHRVPIKEPQARTGWLWPTVGALIAVVGVVVWVTRPEPASCDPVPAAAADDATSRMALSNSSSGVWLDPEIDAPVPTQRGEARYTAFGAGASCSIRGLPPDGFYVGVSTEEYGRADLCGAYLDVHGPHGDVRVLVADRCPGCARGQLDLSTAAFEQIAERSAGIAQVSYSVVRDPHPAPELFYEVKPDSTAGWFAILWTGSGNPIQRVALRSATGSSWRELHRGMDNYWTISGAGAGPFSARVTDIQGHQVEISDISLEPGRHATGTPLYTEQSGGSAPAVPAPMTSTRPEIAGAAPSCRI